VLHVGRATSSGENLRVTKDNRQDPFARPWLLLVVPASSFASSAMIALRRPPRCKERRQSHQASARSPDLFSAPAWLHAKISVLSTSTS
jgi:hypothetical protein